MSYNSELHEPDLDSDEEIPLLTKIVIAVCFITIIIAAALLLF